jgi:hypothetical protein
MKCKDCIHLYHDSDDKDICGSGRVIIAIGKIEVNPNDDCKTKGMLNDKVAR